MNSRLTRARVLSISLYIILASQVFGATLPPIEAFGRVPDISNVVVSADGQLLAWVNGKDAGQQITIHDLATNTAKRVFSVPAKYSVRSLSWFDSETLLINLSTLRETRGKILYRTEIFRTMAFDAKGGPGRVLLMKDSDHEWMNQAIVVRPSVNKPKTVLMWTLEISNKQNLPMYVPTLYEVDLTSGRGTMIDRGTLMTIDWAANSETSKVVRGQWNASETSYRIQIRESMGVWRDIYQQQGEPLEFCGFSASGNEVLALGSDGKSHRKLWAIALDGSGAKPLIEDPLRDVSGVIRDTFSFDALAGILGGSQPDVRWLDKKNEARFRSLAKTFPRRNTEIVSRTMDFNKVVARVDSPSLPAVYYLVDFVAGSAQIVGDEYPDLANAKLGIVQSVSYRARDGYEIPVYLTMPPIAQSAKAPLIVLPHGGPELRDLPQFDWLAQFLATRGYAVMQPQFRGSTGFGEAHREAGYGQWGRLMQDDITDGVKWLESNDQIDGKRACIVGASYGGFAALAGAALTPDLYRCAISINGISDLPAMLGHVKKNVGGGTLQYWLRHIGSPYDKNVIDVSPARRAAEIQIPVLLLHGANDTIVPISQSEAMVRAMTAVDKPVQLITLDGEDHWLSRGVTRLRVLTEIQNFLGKHLPTN